MKEALFAADEVWREADQAEGRRITLYPLAAEGSVSLVAEQKITARLRASVAPSRPFSPGLVPFSPCFVPEVSPEGIPTQITADLLVPAELCRSEDFSRLALYTLIPGRGWEIAPDQLVDDETRMITAEWTGARPFVILGPKSCLAIPAPAPGEEGRPPALDKEERPAASTPQATPMAAPQAVATEPPAESPAEEEPTP